MVAPRVEFGALAVPRGAPKSHFLAENQHKIAKKSLQEGLQTNDEKSMKNDGKMDARKGKNHNIT